MDTLIAIGLLWLAIQWPLLLCWQQMQDRRSKSETKL